jgi:hypothetical protein
MVSNSGEGGVMFEGVSMDLTEDMM